MVEPKTDSALSFLKTFASEGPWALTAIAPDRHSVETRTFFPQTLNDCRAWIERYNGKSNIYFHVNPVLKPISKKAEREDIAALAWLHVDIDPRPGEDIDTERARALKLLQNSKANVPPPTCIVFSGGGYQGFWKLKEAQAVNGDLATAEDLKRYNLQLELIFGADNCHNIDRIMRLPGTINIPDAKKKKKGRVPMLAEVVEYHVDRVYDIKEFTKAPILQSEEGGSRSVKVKISGNVERVSLDSLPDKVTDRVKMIIVQGEDPDSPKQGDNSRSAWVFDVVCNLIRADVPDDKIFSILMDPDFRISDSVLEKPRPESYAIRQIERGHEESVHPVLRELNDRHAVIADIGGKCRVISEVFDHALGRTRISRQSFDDFRNRYMHQRVVLGKDKEGNAVTVSAGKWWLGHGLRRQYDTMVFVPGRHVQNAYNLWKGFAYEALPGKCDLFLEHVKKNICGNNEEYYAYMLGWMARCVQTPDEPGEVAVVLRGRMGTGKGFFITTFGRLWGRHFMQIADPKHLVGNFNSHLRDVVVLFADEAFYAGDTKHSSILKNLVTEETITIEAKGVDAENSMNFIHLMMASNADWVVPAGLDERRFFVLDVADNKKQDSAYFAAIQKEMDSGGYEALLHYLLTYDLADYQVRRVPQTEALKEQKQLSMTLEMQWWFNKLEEGRLAPEHDDYSEGVRKARLQETYVEFAKSLGYNRRLSPTALGKFLSKVCPVDFPKGYQAIADVPFAGPNGQTVWKRQRTYHYRFPSLEELRKHFDQHCGGPYKWPAFEAAPPPPQPRPKQAEVF